MSDFLLTQEQLVELRAAHRREKNRRAAYKINAVILLGSGWQCKDVREALLLDDDTLRTYVKKYREGGLHALLKTYHLGRSRSLSPAQAEQLVEALDKQIYLTTAEVIAYVETQFEIRYTPTGMRDLLHRLGFEYKKPKLVPGEPDREAQELFVSQLEAFMDAKPADVEVLFADAVHPQHNTLAAYGWIKKGARRPLKTNSGRQRLNLHGAINVETLEMTLIESKTVDADSTIELLETLNQGYPLSSKIHVVLDNARYHYSKKVKAYLSENPRINLVFLPAYSPQLNPIERVWQFFKKKVLYNTYYADIVEFRKACIHFFRNFSQHRDEMRSLITLNFEGF